MRLDHLLTLESEVAQSCVTLCNPMNCSPPGFSRQEYWSGLPFPSPADLPDPGLKLRSPALQADSLPSEPHGSFFLTLPPALIKGLCIPSGSVVKNLPANANDVGSIPGPGRFPGEGNGNPLQYFCLGNPKDRGAWQATAHGVGKSRA